MNITTLRIEIGVDISDQDIDDIVATALEGGINYWCNYAEIGEKEYFGSYASDQISRGGTLKLYVDEPYEDTDMYVLTLERMMHGIERYLTYPNRPYEIIANDAGRKVIDCENVDAVVADLIVQLALFDEIVYG